MKFLLSSHAYSSNMQNIALALHEASALGAYYTAIVDNYRSPNLKKLRHLIKLTLPALDRQLSRRRITTLPDELVHKNWGWELPCILASRLGMDVRIQDWFWQRSEYSLDRRCARLIKQPQFDAFFGVEYGSLSTIRAAKESSKKSVVAFLSPHHSFRERWVDAEYEKFPELLTPSTQRLLELARIRDRRRDEEAKIADAIYTNSNLTSKSLIETGFPQEKMTVVPLGAPSALRDTALPNSLPAPLRFAYAGPISVTKGVHYLLEAWKLLRPRNSAELHLYGIPLLPKRYFIGSGNNLFVYGSVAQAELFVAYQHAAILVFPTLCDGFGMVVVEALANGLPVITTPNAGAADLIEEGKNGFLIPPGDVKALAERMEWCIHHPKELLEMRRYALATARRWTWSEFRASLRQQLNRILNISLNGGVVT